MSKGKIKIFTCPARAIDTNNFAPAIVNVTNMKTWRTFRAGRTNINAMKGSLGILPSIE